MTTFIGNIDELLERSELKKLADIFRTISFKPLELYRQHKHKRIEIAYVKKGSCIVVLDDENIYFKQNEIMIITSDVLHSFKTGAEGCTLLQLEFLPDIIDAILVSTQNIEEQELAPCNIFSTDNRVVKIVNNVRIVNTIQRLINEMSASDKYYKHLIVMYYTELIILMYRHIQESRLPNYLNPAIVKAVNYVRLHYKDDITISQVSKRVKVSERYLRKLFTMYMNTTPIDFLNQTRLNKAVELLRLTELSVKEVCFQCGFRSHQYFSRIFKQHLGVPPREFRGYRLTTEKKRLVDNQ